MVGRSRDFSRGLDGALTLPGLLSGPRPFPRVLSLMVFSSFGSPVREDHELDLFRHPLPHFGRPRAGARLVHERLEKLLALAEPLQRERVDAAVPGHRVPSEMLHVCLHDVAKHARFVPELPPAVRRGDKHVGRPHVGVPHRPVGGSLGVEVHVSHHVGDRSVRGGNVPVHPALVAQQVLDVLALKGVDVDRQVVLLLDVVVDRRPCRRRCPVLFRFVRLWRRRRAFPSENVARL